MWGYPKRPSKQRVAGSNPARRATQNPQFRALPAIHRHCRHEAGAFARRPLAAYARRVGDGNVEALAQMTALAADLDVAIGQAVTGLRQVGY